MKNFLLAAAVALLAACAVPQGGMGAKRVGGGNSLFGALNQQAQPTDSFVDEVIEVISVPPGAVIMVNDGFVGYAPVKASVRRYWRGAPGSMQLDVVRFSAAPSVSGHCAQSAIYGQNNLKVPSPVRFVMTNCAAQPAGKKW